MIATVNKDGVRLKDTKITSVRASQISYVVLWAPLITLAILYLYLAFEGRNDAWFVPIALVLLGLIGTIYLFRLQIVLTSNEFIYRSMFNKTKISVKDIRAIRALLIGRESRNGPFLVKGPGLLLVIEITPEAKNAGLSVAMKPFSKRQLNDLFIFAEVLGIPVQLDRVVASMMREKENNY